VVTAILSNNHSSVVLQTESGHTARIWGEVGTVALYPDLNQFHIQVNEPNDGPTIAYLWADAVQQGDA
jgi:hypothetical protein